MCGKDAGKKRILSGIFAQDEEQNERPDEKKKENREKSGCEGKSRIFRERIGRIPRLVICGGGHVSAAATKLGKMLGFEVTVLEDRPKFADHVRKAGADNVICAPFKEGLAKIGGDSDTWVCHSDARSQIRCGMSGNNRGKAKCIYRDDGQ